MHLFPTVLAALSCLSIVTAHYPIPGVQLNVNTNTGQRPNRRNILKLQQDTYQWPLYIQALAMLQADGQSNLLSFYQIAGVHGRPYKAWDNAHGSRDNTYTGYCTHDSILFLTWHRPYLALLEQLISKNAVTISKQYTTNQASWLAAGKNLRIPYWDWASNSNIPSFVQSSTVTITTPSGKKTITNPLYSYKFHPLSSSDFPASSGPLASKPATVRGPNANSYLASLGLKSQTYDILTRSNSFLNFGSQLSSGNSLEAIHGNVHVAVAAFSNNYHMADLGYAAFDPIFWLHHTNVDRLWAMWSVLNPNSYLPASTTDQYGTFSINPGSQDTPTTSLIPFWHATNYYNSNSARGTRTFGYTYVEINDWAQSAASQRKNLIAAINTLYGPNSGKKRSFDDDDVIDVERQSLEIIERDNVYSGSSSQTTAWFVSVSVKKFALSAGFNVKVFLGEPTGDPSTWITAGNLVGVLTNFVPKAVAGDGVGGTSKPIYVGGQELPAEVSNMVTHAEFVLDDNLVKKGLAYADADHVASVLKSELVWKVNLMDGTVVDPATISSLNVTVYEQTVVPAQSITSLPTYGAKKDRLNFKHGKKEPHGAKYSAKIGKYH